ncbi:MAG: 1-deoxy-D-xylulose-5-phosphate reductoisomerase, partial [Gammaproteobacteria bacterium]|nr:1-deoxy-D-xylulose-5-phosphate reductoisomerase [Gammaproteobacteria bacterium]
LHPQSLVHSLVEYDDGSMLAQLGNPDMRIPISHALGWPDRITSGAGGLDLVEHGLLQFEAPDETRFPCLSLATAALETGGTAPAILNAANEIAVTAFLDRRIPFTAIPRVIEDTLGQCPVHPADTLQVILDDDAVARTMAAELIQQTRVVVAE